jgi:hypothetical protein
MKFQDMIQHPDVESLAAATTDIHTWNSSVGAQVQAAVNVIAMRQLEETAAQLDDAATRLQRWGLRLAGASLVVSIVALVVTVVK